MGWFEEHEEALRKQMHSQEQYHAQPHYNQHGGLGQFIAHTDLETTSGTNIKPSFFDLWSNSISNENTEWKITGKIEFCQVVSDEDYERAAAE